MQVFTGMNSLSLQMNASSQKQGKHWINPKDKLQTGSVALPLAVLWRHVIGHQDMPSGWQQPPTQTHTKHPRGPSLVKHEAEVTLTLLTPKPLALRLVTAFRILSFGQEKTNFPFGSHTWYQLVSPQNFCQFTHTVFCSISQSLLPLPPLLQPSLML